MILELLFSSGRRPRCPGQRLRNHALKLIQKRKTTKSGERNSVPERIFQALQDKHRINNVKFFGNPIFFINFAPAEGSGAGLLPVGTVGTRQRHVSAAIAQLVEHFIRNEKVVGSSPTRGSNVNNLSLSEIETSLRLGLSKKRLRNYQNIPKNGEKLVSFLVSQCHFCVTKMHLVLLTHTYIWPFFIGLMAFFRLNMLSLQKL